jgi:hypothetical protein
VSPLSVENLYGLAADGVVGQVQSAFTTQLQLSPSVHSTFFGSVTTAWPGTPATDWTDSVAAALACSAIARSSLYGFSATVNGGAADGYWQGQLAGSSGLAASQALYAWAFPTYCTDGQGTTFQAYLTNNPTGWAAQLGDELTSTTFINTDLNKLIGNDPNWIYKVNLAYYKLHLLDPTQEQRVVQAWTAAYSGAVEQWQTYNYLTGLFAPDAWIGPVNAAIGVGKDDSYCSTGGVGVPICSYWTDYGLGVVSFLSGKPAGLGLTTGAKPNNEVDGTGGGGGCFVAGSPLHLHGGETIPIETAGAGHRVLARAGSVGVQTEEQVVIETRAQVPIYGLNDDEPFFSAGHLFWTKDGWKAFEPAIALYENPSRTVGKLEIGDVVHRLRNGTGPEYDEVEIERFTGRLLDPGERLYGMHLDGASTYHVHGYLVGMNYPMITEQRLAAGFAALSPEERALLARTLEPAMPLLRKAVGRFIEEPLRRSLA